MLESLGIGGHLEKRGHLELPRQLGVLDLVGPGSENRGLLNTYEEVGLSAPVAVEEHTLIDHVHALPHGCERFGLARLT